jgi:hypothetical protein
MARAGSRPRGRSAGVDSGAWYASPTTARTEPATDGKATRAPFPGRPSADCHWSPHQLLTKIDAAAAATTRMPPAAPEFSARSPWPSSASRAGLEHIARGRLTIMSRGRPSRSEDLGPLALHRLMRRARSRRFAPLSAPPSAKINIPVAINA